MSAKEVARVLNAFGACHIHQGELDDVIQDYFMMSAAETESDGRFVTIELIKFGPSLAGAPIVMFINIYAGESPIRKTCNFDKPLNHILKVMDGCMHIFCLVSIKTHKIRMLELQPSPFFTDLLHEA